MGMANPQFIHAATEGNYFADKAFMKRTDGNPRYFKQDRKQQSKQNIKDFEDEVEANPDVYDDLNDPDYLATFVYD